MCVNGCTLATLICTDCYQITQCINMVYSDIFVLVQIDRGHEVAWLSELRKVSVAFINLDLGIKEGEKKLHLLQNIFETVYASTIRFEGQLELLQMRKCQQIFVYN